MGTAASAVHSFDCDVSAAVSRAAPQAAGASEDGLLPEKE